MMRVTDYRTATTGIEPGHLSSREYFVFQLLDNGHYSPRSLVRSGRAANAKSFTEIQQLVAGHIHGKIVVGYALWNDLSGTQTPCQPAPLIPLMTNGVCSARHTAPGGLYTRRRALPALS
jgi:hypothetical protein